MRGVLCTGAVLAMAAVAVLPAHASKLKVGLEVTWVNTRTNLSLAPIEAALRPPTTSTLWLVIASRSTFGEADALARSYAPTLGPTLIVQSRNGLYAILAGTLNEDRSKPNLRTLVELHLIPDDSFLTNGSNFERLVSHSYSAAASLDLMGQPALRGTVRRLQAALVRLNMYDGPADGLIGPGTVKSFARYVEGFGLPQGDFIDGYALAAIERNAADGFKSDSDRRLAQSMGFQDALNYGDAMRGGFPDAAIFAQAKGLGFRSNQDFLDARAAGFQTEVEFRQARTTGFASALDFRDAVRQGLKDHAEYVAYRNSGFSNVREFRTAREKGFADKAAFVRATEIELKSARQIGRNVLDDAQTFIRLNPSMPDLIAIADQASALNATLSSGTAETVTAASGKLTTLLAGLPGYQDFAFAREQERVAERNRQVGEVREYLERRRGALTKWIAANISSPDLPVVVGQVKILAEVQQSDDLDRLVATRSDLDATLLRLNLPPELHPSSTASSGTGSDQVGEATPVTKTSANAFLLIGPPDDVVALYNSATAPSLVRTLNGTFSFSNDLATVCLMGVESSPAFERALISSLNSLGAKRVRTLRTDCVRGSVGSVDLMLIRRKQFLEAKPSAAVPILEALETKSLREFKAIDTARLEEGRQAEAWLTKAIVDGIEEGDRSGFGLIVLDDGEKRMCSALTQLQIDNHSSLMADAASYVSSKRAANDRQFENADALYAAAQRGQCGAIYGAAADLKKIYVALKRDEVAFSFAPVWFDDAAVDEAARKTKEAKEAAVMQAEARRLAEEERLRADARRNEEAAQRREEREAVLRKDNGPAAAALLNRLAAGLDAFVLGRATTESKPVETVGQFPAFATWHKSMVNDGWEAASLQTTVEDYGMVNWKGRPLPVIVGRANIRFKSRDLGEYRDSCYLLGIIVDDEFDVDRDPIVVPCENGGAELEPWRQGHGLESKWVAAIAPDKT